MHYFCCMNICVQRKAAMHVSHWPILTFTPFFPGGEWRIKYNRAIREMDFGKKKLQQEFEDKLETEQQSKRHLDRRARNLWNHGVIEMCHTISSKECVCDCGFCSWLTRRPIMKICSALCSSWRRSARNWLQSCRTPNCTSRGCTAETTIWRRNRGSQFTCLLSLKLPS